MKCKYCDIEIAPYQPGTVLVESIVEGGFIAHEGCYKQDREDYRTADEIIAEVENE